ncbi:MAG: N-acetylglutamate synthase, partial [Burkholderiaceae bacterium]|nr:N-acetylglutamate synthase [Burkholderiaceae bacterium]
MNTTAQPDPLPADQAATDPAEASAVAPPPAASEAAPDEVRFVSWLRQVAPYIHAFRGKTFVVA